jgi:hypothetical protein
MNKTSQRNALKNKLLLEQDGKCALCLRGETCAASFKDPHHSDHSTCKMQKVFWLDHNHSHIGCDGCEKCVRGILHNHCNRGLTFIEQNPHLQNDFTKQYLDRGNINLMVEKSLENSEGQ